ncbi:hypothetical protein [Formosa sp. 4Alg 33]|uniref:hypothetical protein n=1 Tax=Formosa sp. 4Alg 33 TaxID=3382189 RepID=UPI003D9C04D2
MALFTILTVASEIASNEKAMDGLSQFAKKGSNLITDFLRDEDDLPDISANDFQNIIEYIEMLSSLLGQGAKIEEEVNLSKMKVISDIINELCFSEAGITQEPFLNYINSSVEELESLIAYKIQNPSTIKKISRYVDKFELEEEFYGYLCRVMLSDSNLDNEEQEYLDIIAESFGINKFDKKSIESNHKQIFLQF